MKKLVSLISFIVCCGLGLSQPKTELKSLREKVITFPEITGNNWVKLQPNESISNSEVTACLRFYTDRSSTSQYLFSLASTSNPQDFVLTWSADSKQYHMYIYKRPVQFRGLPFNLNQWNSACVTWDAKSGLAQMFVNDVSSIKKAVGPKEPFKGEPAIILGQYQPQSEGDFNQFYAFTGFMSDVHVHKQILSARQIKTYMEQSSRYKPGDYINWNYPKYTISGSVQVEEKYKVTF